MAVQDLGKVVTIEAGQDLSTKQFRFMTVAADGQIDPTGDGLDADGVLQDNPAAAGRAANVMVGHGITKVVAGAATTRGTLAASDSAGRAVDAASGDYVLGKFLEAATGAGQLVKLLFRPTGSTL